MMSLSSQSLSEREEHESKLLELEAERKAMTLMDAPTLPSDVRFALRQLGHPVRLFGENLADVRDRLRRLLALQQILKERHHIDDGGRESTRLEDSVMEEAVDEDDGSEMTKYTRATNRLISARAFMTSQSLRRAKWRLQRERRRRTLATERRKRQWSLRLNENDKTEEKEKKDQAKSSKTNKHENNEEKNDNEEEDGDDSDERDELDLLDENCRRTYQNIEQMSLEGSQYADPRAISAISSARLPSWNNNTTTTTTLKDIVVTGSWSGTIKLWDGGTTTANTIQSHSSKMNNNPNDDTDPPLAVLEGGTLDPLGSKTNAHEDRIMGLASFVTSSSSSLSKSFNHGVATTADSHDHDGEAMSSILLATASIDLTAALWRVRPNECKGKSKNNNEMLDPAMDIDTATTSTTIKPDSSTNLPNSKQDLFSIQRIMSFRGHEARLCKVAFHTSGRFVGTTSFDHTWRLWDIQEGRDDPLLLLQDGHARETYGIGMHPDGSLVSTTDFGGVVQCWDLRTGKTICHFKGHAKRVLCSEFAPNGFQLATSGDDGTLKIWDLRRRRPLASIPAHSNLVTSVRFANEFEQWSSSSSDDDDERRIDPTMMDDNGGGDEFLATSSFDGTIKLWSTRDWKLLSTLRGHEGKVMGVDILRGGDKAGKPAIVSCGYDKTLKLWT